MRRFERSGTRRGMASLAPWLILAGSLAHATPRAAGDDDGAVAGPGTWNMHGGTAARTGVCASRPLFEAPRVLWSRDLGGAVVGEPLVMGDCVVVETRTGARERALVILDLRDGAELWSSRAFDAATPLEPSLSGDLIAVRSSTQSVDILRRRGWRVDLARRVERKQAVANPMLFGEELYLRTEQGVECVDPRSGVTRWRQPGTFRGSLALRGDELYAIAYADDSIGRLSRMKRASGEQLESVTVLWHEGRVPAFGDDVSFEVLLPQVTVRSALPIPLAGKRPCFGTIIDFSTPSETIIVASFVAPATDHGTGYFSVTEEDDGLNLTDNQRAGDGTYVHLADREHHAELVRTPLPVSIAGSVGYVAGLAFDLSTHRVLWRHPNPVTRRMVPTDGGVLLVEDDSRLVHLGGSPAEAPIEWLAPEPNPPTDAPLAKANVYLSDGTRERYDVVLDREARVIRATTKKKPTERRFADVCALEDAERRLVFVNDARAWIWSVERAVDAELADKFLALARDAVSARDPALARRLLARACQYGCEGDESEKVLKSITQLALGKAQAPVQAKLNAVLAAQVELDGAHAAALATRLEKLDPTAPQTLRNQLARALLARKPESDAARHTLRSQVAAGLERCADADLEGALELTLALQRFDGQVVPLPSTPVAAPGADATPSQHALATASTSWRADLLAVRTPRLYLLCAPESPRAITRAIAYGELACRGLEPLFGDVLRKGPPLEPLVVQVYESPERYMAISEKTNSEEPRNRDRAFSHFDPSTLVTHVGLPIDESTLVSARDRYVHAIAHHWTRERCPRFSQRYSRRANRKEPGYWIAEGLAGYAEELVYDLAAGTVQRPTALTDSLALNASVSSRSLFEWPTVLAAPRDFVDGVSGLPSGSVPRRGWLGRNHATSTLDIFCAQATALVHYFDQADDGKRRSKLVDFAHAYYIGTADQRLDFKATFGSTPEEIGDAVYEWASARARESD